MTEQIEKNEAIETEEPPPFLGSWKNIYWLVLGNLVFWVSLFTMFTWMFHGS